MVQCSPLREATLSAHRAAARFGAYHRAAYGGYYTTKRHTQRAAYLSPERLRPFRGGSMFSQPSEILDFRLRREVIIPCRGSKRNRLTLNFPLQAGFKNGTLEKTDTYVVKCIKYF